MTLSDPDLETRLRDQRIRAEEIPPAPFDLAQRVRERAREQRRRRIALTAAGIAAALIFIGLPALASGLVDDGSRGESAAPPSRRPPVSHPLLSEVPTRGSLADDEGWLQGVVELSWRSPELEQQLDRGGFMLHDPAVDTRHVAYADDVPGGRVALVFGLDSRPVHAWFVGPEDAEPEEMTLATIPGESTLRQPMALWATPDSTSEEQVLVVVGLPGDEVDVLTGREATAAGEVHEIWQSVPMEDGAGAVAPDRPFAWPPPMDFRMQRDGQREPLFPTLDFSDRLIAGAQEPIEVADPRGLAGAVNADELQWTVQMLLMHYGLPAEQLRPTLLAGGPVGAGSSTSAILVGVTFPSGATTTHLTTYWGASGGMTSESFWAEPAPAGTALLDRIIAVASSNALTVSGPPEGAMVEVYLADGTPFTTMPLVAGTGIGPLPPPGPPRSPEIARIRILDAKGSFVTEAPVEVVE